MLLILACAMIVSTIMCSAYPMFRQKANQNIAQWKEEHLQEEQEPSYIYFDERGAAEHQGGGLPSDAEYAQSVYLHAEHV